MKKVFATVLTIGIIVLLAGCTPASSLRKSQTSDSSTSQAVESSQNRTTILNNEISEETVELEGEAIVKKTEDTVVQLKEKFTALKTEIDSFDKYAANASRVNAFYDEILSTTKSLCLMLEESSVTLAEKIVNSSGSKGLKYDELAVLQESIYDDAGEVLYDDIYDGVTKDMLKAFYDGVIKAGYDTKSYGQWSEMSSAAYEKWSDTSSDVYEMISEARSDIYGFASDVRSEVYSNDMEKANKKIQKFKKEVEANKAEK